MSRNHSEHLESASHSWMVFVDEPIYMYESYINTIVSFKSCPQNTTSHAHSAYSPTYFLLA